MTVEFSRFDSTSQVKRARKPFCYFFDAIIRAGEEIISSEGDILYHRN